NPTGNRYISLKPNYKKFVSKSSPADTVILDIEIDMFALTPFLNFGNEDTQIAFDQGYYNFAFRVDIYVGNVLQASSRRGTPVYDVSTAPELSYQAGSVVNSNPNESSYRILTENIINAKWKVSVFITDVEGELDIRFYDPVFPVYVPPVPSYIVQKK